MSDKQEGLQMPGWVKKRRLVHVWQHAVRVAGKFPGRDDLVSAFACEYTDRRRLADECERLREKLMKIRRGEEIGDNIADNRTPPHDKRWDLRIGTELKPCRYCGRSGMALGVVKSVIGDFAIECDCWARGPSKLTPNAAAEAWNKMVEGC